MRWENRPACRSSTEQPGERATQIYDVIAGQRALKLRPNRVTVVPQAWEKARVLGALRPGHPWAEAQRRIAQGVPLPNRHRGSGARPPRPAHAAGRRLSLRGDRRESEAQSFRSDPWAAVRRARLDPMQPVPDSGDGNPPGFLAGNAGKARNCVNYLPDRRAKGRLRTGKSASTPKSLAPFALTLRSALATTENRPRRAVPGPTSITTPG